MLTIPGYILGEQLYESNHSLIFRGQRITDQQPLILKYLKNEYPSPEEIARFKREYDIIRKFDDEGIIRTDGLKASQHTFVILLEDCGGRSLAELLPNHPLSLTAFLHMALRITNSLRMIHQHNIVHKDVNPSNIIWNPQTGQVKVIDFGIAAILSREIVVHQDSRVMEGTLAYMAPEQTGRMNRSIDFRTDLYALGVTFYQMATGFLPFPAEDPLELVHAHLAKMPVPPCDLTPIPPLLKDEGEQSAIISTIITKLLAKTPEDRYQSAYGLSADLQICLNQRATTGTIEPFVIGREDASDRLQLPQKLYARDVELNLLRSAYDRIRQGTTEMICVTGESGLGKSALVQELRPSVAEQRGSFIIGSFNEFTQEVPYVALIQAFQMLIRQTLTETEEEMQQAQDRLRQAVGPNGQVILDVIPETELLIGPQPPVPDLPPDKAQNRFNLVVRNVLQTVVRAEVPLVIFLDNAQWADIPSLKLLEFLVSEAKIPYLLLIMACRAGEIAEGRCLTAMFRNMPRLDVEFTTIALTPLELPAVRGLLADTFRTMPEHVQALADVVLRKTGGNPFFLRQFLQTLDEKGLLQFDLTDRCWTWQLEGIQQESMTANVIDVMTRKIEQLSAATQTAVKYAACIGYQFDLATLAQLREHTMFHAAQDLWRAIQNGLIVPLEAPYPYVDSEGEQTPLFEHTVSVNVQYAFLHTRVQQAAYFLLSEAERHAIHLKLGRMLFARWSEKERGEHLFDLASHFNRAQHLITSPEERLMVADLNLRAGKKALASTAHQSAYEYLQQGLSFLPSDCWQARYELTLALFSEASGVAYLSGHVEHMHALVTAILQHARSVLDQVPAYEALIQTALMQNNPLQAIACGRRILTLLGIHLPRQPGKIQAALGLLFARVWVAGKPMSQIADYQEGTASKHQPAMRILASIAAPAYFARPNLMPWLIFHAIRLSIKQGNTTYSAFSYAGYGLMLCGLMGDLDTGYEFGTLALQVVDLLNAKEQQAKVFHVTSTCIRHWKEPYADLLQPLLEGYRAGMENGDLEFGCYTLATYGYLSFFIGKELTALEQELADFRTIAGQLRQPITYNCLHIYHHLVSELLGRLEHLSDFPGTSQNTEQYVHDLLAADDRHAVFQFYFTTLLSGYLFHAYAQAVRSADRVEDYLDGAVGIACVPLYYFYDSLARLAALSDATPPQRRHWLRRITVNQRKLKKWAHSAPMNYRHRWLLVEAERFRVLQRPAQAMDNYDHAIALARQYEYLQDDALANELAAAFYVANNKRKVAQAYIRDARYSYLKWGAQAKVADIDLQYPDLAAMNRRKTDLLPLRPSTTLTAAATGGTNVHLLDLTTVMKASLAISGEIVLDKLLTQLMTILIENAGAQKGVLILEQHGRWLVEAEGRVEMHQDSYKITVHVLHSLPLEQSPQVSAAIVNYVLKTKEAVVLRDATQSETFATDLYIQASRPKSLLCTPILHGGQFMGVVYLENNLAADVFTPDRLEVIQLLSSQAAISLENARLYQELQQYNETLEATVTARTAELQEKNAQLQELNASKDKFFSIISHDLRSPFMALLGYTEMMVEDFEQYTAEHLKEFAGRVHTSAERLFALLENLLTWSRVQIGVMEYQPEAIDLQLIVKDIVELFVPKAEQKQIALQHTLSSNVLVYADVNMIHTVIRNLVSNALKFTPVGGCVTLSAAHADEPSVEVAIADTGCGIDADGLSKLFRLDVHYSTRGTAGETGTGLGLLLCKDLVEKNGGHLSVESEIGKGTTFRFTVPHQRL